MELAAKKERLRIFDALRGFSIILVVLGHVLLYMDLGMNNTILSRAIITFRMPLFFFVSGFFAFRASEKWTSAVVGDIVVRKIRAQIICTFVFYFAYQLCFSKPLMAFATQGFGGFWFTIALFQIYLLFLTLSLLGRLWGGNRLMFCGMVAISIAAAVFSFHVRHLGGHAWRVLAWTQLTEYLQFFTLGLFARHFQSEFERLLSATWFRTLCILGFFGCLFSVVSPLRINFSFLARDILSDFPARYFGLFCLLIYFFAQRQYFERPDGIPTWLNHIGTRTLDIYMMHYFFLPHLPFMAKWLGGNSMFALQLAVSGVLALLVVAICMVFSNLIRTSPFLAVWLFGVRRKS